MDSANQALEQRRASIFSIIHIKSVVEKVKCNNSIHIDKAKSKDKCQHELIDIVSNSSYNAF